MTFARRVEPETLDHLAVDDPRAVHSRRDLRRVHRAMGTLGLLRRAVLQALDGKLPRRIAELGAGDGTLMLRLAGSLRGRWPGVTLVLVDRQDLVSAETEAAFARLGWTVQREIIDVADWLRSPLARGQDLVIANLFLHHFDPLALAMLLEGVAQCSAAVVALEPRRDLLALAGSHLIGLLGCNEVTRHDAVLSVHAGFRGRELTMAWPARGWSTAEGRAGLFAHRFVGRRQPDPA